MWFAFPAWNLTSEYCSVLQLPRLHAYKGYCSNQLAAKALLDQKKQDRRVQDFLQRCLESPFSRKLDLWSFLDIPRSRLVKYPLLLKEILRHTPKDHPDIQILEEAVSNSAFMIVVLTKACHSGAPESFLKPSAISWGGFLGGHQSVTVTLCESKREISPRGFHHLEFLNST